MLDAALQKLLSVIDSLVPSTSQAGASERNGANAATTSSAAPASSASSSGAAAAAAAAGSEDASSSSTSSSFRLLYEASPAIPAAGEGKPARGPEYRVLAAKAGWPKLEGAETLYELWTHSVEKFGPRRCLGWRPKVNGVAQDYEWMTYEDAAARVEAVGSALVAAGVTPKERIGVFGSNCPEWMIAMQACNRQNLFCVPLYDSLGENAVQFILEHSTATAVFAAADKLAPLSAAVKLGGLAPSLKVVVVWGDVPAAGTDAARAAGLAVTPWSEFLESGKKKPAPPSPPKASDLCTIMYTSGTTGDPKGVEISHGAVVSTVAGMKAFLASIADGPRSFSLGVDDVMLSYLPLAHIFDRVAEELMLSVGGRVGYFQGDVKHLVDDIGALRPTLFLGVPRVFDRIYSGATAKIAEAGGIKALLFHWGFRRKLWALRAGIEMSRAAPFFDRLVFSKLKQRLGGRVRLIVSGGAPLARHVEDFLSVCMCSPVVQGYGLTETCAASFVAVPGDHEGVGTVGPPLPSVGLRLEAVPEMGCDPFADPPRGEVCICGPTVFSGYYRDDEKTREVLDADGTFHTGDIGELTPHGMLRIVDRKKNIFKLSQGEYIAVEKIEAVYKKCPLVEQVWVYGNSFESALVAVVVPAEAVFRSSLAAAGVAGADDSAPSSSGAGGDGSGPGAEDKKKLPLSELCKKPEAVKHVLAAMTATGKEAKLKGFEFVKALHLDDHHFSVEDDTLTPTFKLKRPQLQKRYQAKVDELYAKLKQGS